MAIKREMGSNEKRRGVQRGVVVREGGALMRRGVERGVVVREGGVLRGEWL